MGVELFHADRQTNGRTDIQTGMTKLVVAFRNSATVPNKKMKVNWIGPIFRRNCLLKHIVKGKIGRWVEVTEGRGIRRKQLLDDRKETEKTVN